ncbi:surface antigen D15 [Candidatus Magnetomorum sp. HK-1]|nr:surface antigen D15 [Candidatus Magnetomorum sp. HK-1]
MKKRITSLVLVCIVTSLTHNLNSAQIQSQLTESNFSNYENNTPEGTIFIKRYLFEGNTVFSDSELLSIISQYQNKQVSRKQLAEAKNIISNLYYANGYINSGAIIPDQELKDGALKILIIEGKATSVDITGNKKLKASYYKSRLEAIMSDNIYPLNINHLQDALNLLSQNPRVETFHVAIEPEEKLGHARIKIKIEESNHYHLATIFNNHQSPGVGSYCNELIYQHLNVFGFGDTFNLTYGVTQGRDDYSTAYTFPISSMDSSISLLFDRTKSAIISEPFNVLDIKSESDRFAIFINHPVYKTTSSQFTIGLGLVTLNNKTYIFDDVPISFSEGYDNGESKVTKIDFSQEWLFRKMDQVIIANSTFSFGLDCLQSTVNGKEPDGKFTSWSAQLHWLSKSLKNQREMLFKLNLQVSLDHLLPGNQFSMGGASTVRGYRENQITTDNGIMISNEFRFPLYKIQLPWVTKKESDGQMQIIPFADFGKGWNTDRSKPEIDMIYSIGLGMRWLISRQVLMECYWGKALKAVPESNNYNIQDDGIHFNFQAKLF